MSRRDQWACFCFCCYVFAGIAAAGAVGADLLSRYEATIARYEQARVAYASAVGSALAWGGWLFEHRVNEGSVSFADWQEEEGLARRCRLDTEHLRELNLPIRFAE